MIQQVNLYQESDTGAGRLLRNPYLWSFVAAVATLTGASLLTWHTFASQRERHARLEHELQQTTADVLLLQAQAPNQQSAALLNQELQQSQTLYQSLSQIVEMLADTQSDPARGFSRYFTALGEQSDGNVWLGRIRIDAAEDAVSLQGSSLQPENIPALLQRLQHTEAFKRRRFARMNIRQSQTSPEQVDFSVGTTLEPEHGTKP